MRIISKILPSVVLLLSAHLLRAQQNDDWAEIQKVLGDCTGLYSGVNDKVPTSGMPDGPLLGNGRTGVVGACDNTWGRFYITTTDFWNGAHLDARPLPIGGINIIAGGSPGTGVRQQQQLQDAAIVTTLTNGLVKMQTWVAATKNILVTELSTSGTLPVPVTVETWTHNNNTSTYPVSNGVDPNNTGWATRRTQDDKTVDWVCRAALATRVLGTAYTMKPSGNNMATAQFMLRPGKKIWIVTAIRSGKNEKLPVAAAIDDVKDQTPETIASLKKDHLAWWKNYWLKSFVRTYDPQLEKYYYGALYESACCYREGSICPALYGAWVTTDTPNWDGNYTLSYNHQSTVVGFCSSNRPELLLPYMQQRYDWEAEAKKRARRGDINFVTGNRWGDKFRDGIPGIFDPITEGPWGSSASGDLYMGMLAGSVWAAIPIMRYCDFTRDQHYLSAVAYPYLKEITAFWEAYLVKENAKWVIKYAGSTEWVSNDVINSAYDNAYVKELFRYMLQFSEELKVDQDKRSLWKDYVDNMKELPIGNWNGQDVFYPNEGGTLKEGEWPGLALLAGQTESITMSSNADLKARFVRTIDAYNSWERCINATGFLWASAVKGGYPAQSLLDQFKNLLSRSMRRNFTVPTGGHGTESVANLEYINSTMLQSQEGFLRIFPEWPGTEAKFKRLRAQGAFLVSGEMVNGQVPYVEVYSEKGTPCTLLNPGAGHPFTLTDGKGQPVEHTLAGDKIHFATRPGETYRLTIQQEGTKTLRREEDGISTRIGKQVWMTRNLDVGKFRNGDSIAEARTKEDWIEAGLKKKAVWCYYENKPEYGIKYGRIYNWYAVSDPRGLVPVGYHVPDDAGWTQLAMYFGGRDVAGTGMRSDSSFAAPCGGYRNHDGAFLGMGINGYWWSSTTLFGEVESNLVLDQRSSYVFPNYNRMQDGLYVRCIRD